jgi:hypothetical protein
MHGASEQCMHATEIDFGADNVAVDGTTRRRFTPQGTLVCLRGTRSRCT